MRLSKIKISGFKSFVDHTNISFPTNLVGIVGPNGCGKSNTIDAVRWVMGESSAKHLRGSSMTDVIFNGSTSRKPVGQASIELIFDNTDKSAGGQYAIYNEISVRRIMSRDGTSNYFLNGTRCRKKDITDLFLGTGLGPRSYAIIEQGMISRIIEAKPEELRVYIEEAAGISKYKERRRETETRLRNTRENLERLTDLREEVGKQLEKLQRQARAAERYKKLKAEERQIKSELLTIKISRLNKEIEGIDREIASENINLEKSISDQRRSEKNVEQSRIDYSENNEKLNKIQEEFYSVGGEIARIEQTMQHKKNLRGNFESEATSADVSLQSATEQLEDERILLEEAKLKLEEIGPLYEDYKEKEQESAEYLNEVNHKWQEWQNEWDYFNRRSLEPVQRAEAERSKIDQIEKQINQHKQRLERLHTEKQNITDEPLLEEIEILTEEEFVLKEKQYELQHELEGAIQSIDSRRSGNRDLSTELSELKGALQQKSGRLSSLEALQQAAFGKDNKKIKEWLQKNNLDDVERLGQSLSVTRGWEKAVETVLGSNIESLCIDNLEDIIPALESLDKGAVTAFSKQHRPQLSEQTATVATRLSEYINSEWGLDDIVGGVYAVEDITHAIELRAKLAATESIVTRDGIWLGYGWIRVSRSNDSNSGVISRESEIKELRDEIFSQEEITERITNDLAAGREKLTEFESRREELQRSVNDVHRQVSSVNARIGGKKMRLEQIQERKKRIETDIAEAEGIVATSLTELEESRKVLHKNLAESEKIESERESREEVRDQLREEISKVQEAVSSSREQSHNCALELQSVKHIIASKEQAITRFEIRIEELQQKKSELAEKLLELDEEADLPEKLERFLIRRKDVEGRLADAKDVISDIEQRISQSDQLRMEAEKRAQISREKLEGLRIKLQELRVHHNNYISQLQETGNIFEDIERELSIDATEQEWNKLLEETILKIQRLGSINLAAIDEYKEEYERKLYLDKQDQDLNEALESLENAIKKIDRETRTRFKETFDKVNSGIQEMFPRLFGGGHAYLELTGVDLLDTGVSVMARPPGKKISNIQLMSGGEKALTAVALVFSIFQLNPAPFCMLDEVDAPLDEANVGRFGQLVKEMSETVQFIFITHNKATMEISTHLMGVTMHEPGVSRIVSVDVDAAVELTGAI
ncbi:MAG: chromosome segregation protein SMC [Gammaproteobacteria bacterium]|nr:MAG: chromosome segregation protein SMC [Gammaproteobacteria bacterium]